MSIIEQVIKDKINSMKYDVDLLNATIEYNKPDVEILVNKLNSMVKERDQLLRDIEELKTYLEGLK